MNDVNKPVTDPELLESLKQLLQNDTEDNRLKVIEEVVMNARFLIPADFSDFPETKDGNTNITLNKDTIIHFHTVTNTEDQTFYLAFTDWDELKKWQNDDNQKTIVLTFDNYASMVLKDDIIEGFIINPSSASLIINRQMLELLKN